MDKWEIFGRLVLGLPPFAEGWLTQLGSTAGDRAAVQSETWNNLKGFCPTVKVLPE